MIGGNLRPGREFIAQYAPVFPAFFDVFNKCIFLERLERACLGQEVVQALLPGPI
jgi:hypothetical protein